ncbi:MAG: insulinase family protein [Spirochaetaceae bacterium]|nr:insulinase family protein [Myxococcales bacterium]MCB9726059.1 insulinase family protein [Spirochaetaceae bacterium]HPG24248.1 pitrilysin family protein [Myxococcota bacterium]
MSRRKRAPALRRLRIALVLVLSGLAPIGLWPTAAGAGCQPIETAPLASRLVPRVETGRLANGLRYVVVPRDGEHSVTVRIAYDVGSRRDPEGLGGLAHVLEHLMFDGSPTIGPGEHFRRVRDVGGRVNAITDWDLTDYVETIPPGAFDRVLASEADRMRGVALSDDGLATQLASIEEEEALRLSNVPYAVGASAFLSRLWAGTPYARSPLGPKAERRAIRLEDVARFHAEHYAPGNALVVVVGAIDPAEARRVIETRFGDVPPRALPAPPPPVEVDARPRHVTLADPLAPVPVYGLVWHAVPARHPDAPAVAVLDDLLLGHRDARLALARKGRLALQAYSISFALREAGLLSFVFAPRTFARFAEIREEVETRVARLAREGPDAAELCRAIVHEQSEGLAAVDTNEGLAGVVARDMVETGEPLAFVQRLDALAALTPEAVRDVARRTFESAPSTLVIAPTGPMRWLKPVLEWLPDAVGASLERSLL